MKKRKTCLERIAELEEEYDESPTYAKSIFPIDKEIYLSGKKVTCLLDGIEVKSHIAKPGGDIYKIFPFSNNYYIEYIFGKRNKFEKKE